MDLNISNEYFQNSPEKVIHVAIPEVIKIYNQMI